MDTSGEKRAFATLRAEEESHIDPLQTPSGPNSAAKRLKQSVSQVLSGAASALTSVFADSSAAAAAGTAAATGKPRASPAPTANTAPSSLASTPAAIDLTGNDEDEISQAAAAVAIAIDLTADTPPQPKRRSSREKKSTLIYVDGYAVKRDNNYVVKGGEYVHGAFDANGRATDGGALARLPKPSNQIRKAAAKKPPHKPRAPSKAEQERARHNEVVKGRVASKAKARMGFLATNAKTIEPFVDSKTRQHLAAGPALKDTWEDMSMQPDVIKGELRDYQMIGLNWMAKMHSMNAGMILGDEMGLGKTLQTISLLAHMKEHEKVTGPSLVICPLSVLYSWCSELEKWAPDLKYLRLHSSCLDERERQKRAFTEKATSYDVVVTTYEMAKVPSLASLWSRMHFNYLVLDEGHKIKNAESLISQGVRHIHCENKLILTGTPLQNNLVELWSLLNFLYPDIFTTTQPFADAFDIVHNSIDKEKLVEAHALLDLFMIRRMKDEVEKLMPPKIETQVICPLSQTQIFWYKAILMKDLSLLARMTDKVEAQEAGGGREKQAAPAASSQQLNNLVMQLRKTCLHPFLFEGAELDIEATTLQDLIAASGKLATLDKLLRSLFQKGHRTVLFSQFTSVLDILDDYCRMRGWKYCRFDGSTPRARRNFIINQFNAPDSDQFVFLMSTRSGGMGLNLQTADTCILFDSDWNPQPDLQAMARVHRIGQKKTVHVYRLVSGGTIEERIVERAQKKLYLDKMVNRGSSESEDKDKGMSGSELLKSIQFGCNAVFGGTSQSLLPTNEDIEIITDRKRTENDSVGKLKGGAAQTTDNFDAEFGLKDTQSFGGIDFRSLREKQKKEEGSNIPSSIRDVAVHWANANGQSTEKRDRKSRLVMVKGNGSGYGKAFVPVLAANNYELESGEGSVFDKELKGKKVAATSSRKKEIQTFAHQDFCQACGDDESGPNMLRCPRCPVSLHLHCSGVGNDPKYFACCSHHHCTSCGKTWTGASGILFPCQTCPSSFCEDCLPKKNVRLLGRCERMEQLGYDSIKKNAYIHCSKECENFAKAHFGWNPPRRSKRECPPEMDFSHNFASNEDDEKVKAL